MTESLCTESNHCSLAACHVSRLREMERRERDGRRRRSHVVACRKVWSRKEKGPRNEMSPMNENGTVFDCQAELVARHRMKRPRIPLRQDVSGVVFGRHPLEVHHPLFHQLAHVMIRRPDVFCTLPLDGVPYQRLRAFGIREDLQAPARLIQSRLTQNVDMIFRRA